MELTPILKVFKEMPIVNELIKHLDIKTKIFFKYFQLKIEGESIFWKFNELLMTQILIEIIENPKCYEYKIILSIFNGLCRGNINFHERCEKISFIYKFIKNCVEIDDEISSERFKNAFYEKDFDLDIIECWLQCELDTVENIIEMSSASHNCKVMRFIIENYECDIDYAMYCVICEGLYVYSNESINYINMLVQFGANKFKKYKKQCNSEIETLHSHIQDEMGIMQYTQNYIISNKLYSYLLFFIFF